MKRFAVVPAVLFASFGFLPICALAGSATWNLNPTSNDWDTAANWTPATVPNDPSDIATFDVSNVTSISQDGEFDVAEVVFNPGANAFTIIAHYPGLNLYGTGITNNSGVVQTFGAVSGLESEINFYNSATAGEDTILFQQGSTIDDNTVIVFHDTSSAGSATIINYGNPEPNGGTYFYDSSTAGNATIFNRSGLGCVTSFSGTSSAGSATIVCETGGIRGGQLNFVGDSSAEEATIIVNGAPPRAGGASVTFSALIGTTATAGNATFMINGGINGGFGGTLSFNAASRGGTAQVTLSGNGTLDLTGHDPGTVSIGSLAGSGLVLLGTTNLSVGTNDFRTEFSGKIQDNAGPPGASLTKTGSGSLALSGTNAYDGGTFVGSGTLFVNNVTGSGTGSGTVQVNRGALGGNGIISGPVRIGDSVSGAARFMPGRTERSPGVLTIANTLTFNSDGSYLWLLNSARGIASSVTTKGATIGSVSFFTPHDLQSAPLSAGTVFTVINNTSPGAIFQTFKNLPDGGTITVGSNTFQAKYEGGDGNDLTLTVVSN